MQMPYLPAIYILEKLASNRMKSCLRAIMYQERKWNLQSKEV